MGRITTRSVEPLQFFVIAYLVVIAFRILVWLGAGALILTGGALVYQHRASATPGPQWANSPPEVQAWFKQQHNSKGEWCCDEGDAHTYFGDYTVRADGSVVVDLNGQPHVLSAEIVLRGPNPTGHAVWWFREIGGQHRDYCFAPGALM